MALRYLSWACAFRSAVFIFLLAAVVTACFLKDFLIWVKQDLGPWGPLVLAVAYIPLTVLSVPASVLTLGGGYLFGLPVGFVADSVGATLGATASFFLGRTIVLLLRLAPLVPFNMLNYLLSVTPVNLGDYVLASWLGMMPTTFALVYVGTTLKDLSDVTDGWNGVSTTHWVFIALGFGISVILMACITKVAKASLDKAVAENAEIEGILSPSMLSIGADSSLDLRKPLIVRIDSDRLR
ncbi:hypothetical protein ACFX2I_031135 [Malus domestica]